jgi:hypothetical protein
LHQFRGVKTGRQVKKSRAQNAALYRILHDRFSGRAATTARHYFCYRVAFPHTQQKDLCAGGIFENVKNVLPALHFEEAGATGIGLRWSALLQKHAQFTYLF